MSVKLTQLTLDLGIAVGDYNSGSANSYKEIVRLTIEYLNCVKECVEKGIIKESEIRDYFAMIGQSWATVEPRVGGGAE
jgi:hypothetical protein